MMKKKNLILVIGILMCVTLVFMEQARAIVFPDPTTSIDGVPVSSRHTDFYSFSLPILGYFANPKANFNLLPQNPFYVDADKHDIIIGTGQSGQGWLTNIAGMDHPYDTPAANTTFAFSTGTYSDPGEETPFSGDTATTWDIELSALAGYLGGDDLMFFFNHNETGGSDDDLYAWGRAKLVDLDGAKPDIDFFFADEPGIPAEFDPPDGSWSISDIPGQYVYAPSDVCILTPWGMQCLEHNLGTSKSAYAVFSPELNDYLKNYQTPGHDAYGYDAMQADFRLAGLNGGYEQLFIQAGHTIIPEPTTMFLLGSGLLGLAGFGFRKKRKA